MTTCGNNLYFAGFKATENHKESQRATRMYIHEITEKIIGCAIEVHKQLGRGLPESAYEASLQYDMGRAGLQFQNQLGLPLIYKELKLETGYRPGFLAGDDVVVEIKPVEELKDVYTAQVLTYLK